MNRETLLAEVIKETLDCEGYKLEDIRENVPKNFWVKVFKGRTLAPYFNNRNMASNYFCRPSNKKAILSILEGLYAGNEGNVENVDNAPKLKARNAFASELNEQRVREIVQEELSHIQDRGMSIHNDMNESFSLCPESPTIKGEGQGRRQEREYDRVSITVDKVLWRLFREEQQRLKIPAPRLLDSILWHRYGQPRLSFEVE